MDVVVGRLGRPQGLRGEVTVEVRTDEPDLRFADGAVLGVRTPDLIGPPGDGRPQRLVVASSRWHNGRLLLAFDGVPDRTTAETLRNLLVVVEVDPDQLPDEDGAYYDRQLEGLRALLRDGCDLGMVHDVLHLPGQDVLVVRAADGREVLVPFVEAIVPEIDLVAGTVLVDPPPGLFDDATSDADPGQPRA